MPRYGLYDKEIFGNPASWMQRLVTGYLVPVSLLGHLELTISRNVGDQLPSDTASYHRRTYISLIPQWEPSNLHIILVISRASRSTQRHTQLLPRWTSSELFPEINLSGLEVYYLPLSSDGVKECLKLYIHPSYRPTFMSWYFIKNRTTFTLHTIQKIANGKEKE